MWTLLAVLAAADPQSALRTDPFAVSARVFSLSNGMRVVVERQARTDQVASHLHVGVGSGDERDGEHGCAHLFEHLMFEGSGAVPGNAYDQWLTEAGGVNNAFTSEDETAYHTVSPGGALDRLLFLESDRIRDLSGGLTAAALTNQIDVVLREREQGYSAPHGRDIDAVHRTLFPVGHPYHVPVIGTVGDVRGFTLDAVRAFHQRHYRPDNVVFGLVGNLDPEQAEARVRHWFSDVGAVSAPVPPPRAPCRTEWPTTCDVPVMASDADIFLEDNVDDYTATLAWRGARSGTADEAALFLASVVLSGGRGTPVDDLYYRSRGVTGTSANTWSGEVDGIFWLSVSVERPRLAWVERRLLAVLRELASRPPTDEQLARAKKMIRGMLLDSLEQPESRAEVLVDCVRLYGDPGCTRTEWERIDAVTPAQVSAAVAKVLASPRLTLSVVPPGEAGERVGGRGPAVEAELP
jgi:predicted Zn-dependent peptidase